MARIIDKDTRMIDVDFGPVTIAASRNAAQPWCTSMNESGNGLQQMLNLIQANENGTGSFIQYERLDLDFMARNNEVMMPVDVAVQRTSPVPLGFSTNGNNYDQIEEYIYIFSRPLNNHNLRTGGLVTNVGLMEDLRSMGLDRAEGNGDYSGNAGWPTLQQCIFAEKRMYSYSQSLGATQTNGGLIANTAGEYEGSPTFGGSLTPIPAVSSPYSTIMGMPVLDSVTTWGSLAAITGPSLHCYRIVMNKNQSFIGIPEFTNLPLAGQTQCKWPPVSVRFLCKDPNYSEGEYLTRLANAMNNTAEGGPTA